MSGYVLPLPKAAHYSTGIYSAIFIMYIQYHASKNRSDKRKTILFFAICALYILSIVTIILDFAGVGIFLVSKERNHPCFFYLKKTLC